MRGFSFCFFLPFFIFIFYCSQQADNASVPVFLEKMCEHLLANGAAGCKTKGIFRVPPAKAELDQAKQEVEFFFFLFRLLFLTVMYIFSGRRVGCVGI